MSDTSERLDVFSDADFLIETSFAARLRDFAVGFSQTLSDVAAFDDLYLEDDLVVADFEVFSLDDFDDDLDADDFDEELFLDSARDD